MRLYDDDIVTFEHFKIVLKPTAATDLYIWNGFGFDTTEFELYLQWFFDIIYKSNLAWSYNQSSPRWRLSGQTKSLTERLFLLRFFELRNESPFYENRFTLNERLIRRNVRVIYRALAVKRFYLIYRIRFYLILKRNLKV